MKKFVVSLESRQERRRWFDDTNHRKIEYEFFSAVDGSRLDYHYLCQNGYDTNKNWIDPIHNTHITSGEVGCFISHYILWKKCIELDEPIIIFEDDGVISQLMMIW
jgi:glycosyl transferase family 25